MNTILDRPGRAPTSRRSALKKGAVGLAAASLAVTALTTLPASGTVVENTPGTNITVFQNIDFVAVFGYAAGEELTVEVLRNGVVIGTATGNAAGEAPEIGLEVNHGPEGTPVPGDCWEGHTPDIRPGDHIRVSSGGTVTDEVIVDNLRFTGQPREKGNGDIVVPFVAKRANGQAIRPGFIDSAEFRAGSDLRFESTDILVQRQPGAKPGHLQMVYESPFRPSRNREPVKSQAQMRRLLLGDGHATGFGHVAVLPEEGMLLDGLGDTPGPAPGCDGSSAQWEVSNVAPNAVNTRTVARGLTVRGSTFAAEGVQVNLTDRDPSTPARVVTKAAAVTGNAWTATFTRRQLRPLNGRIVVNSRHTMAGETASFGGPSAVLLKDLVAPNAPRASVRAGTLNRPRRVALRSAPGNQIRYTLGNGKQARPTRNSGAVYRGKRIRITSSQTLKAIAIDRAGNVSPLLRNRYNLR
ncbi:MAG: chitobiase/beta-hexosaminidase C-terminal domain-containing protein [Actinomycetota bacterium]|nr:chitobiase/beta-hexosaminidase C-terminal domain-containing protein [Actinomycetota bacterium]